MTRAGRVMRARSGPLRAFSTAIFATIPISPQVTSRGVELSVNQAQAILGHWRRVNRRVYRRAYRRGYYGYYGAPGYYRGYGYGLRYGW
ncbi:MAG TPA: hypothetical protein VKB89_20815 [Xanthobacteraceae bacterium]|nr:hypothetical protein [Xanthobacteraceae bacterium]